MRILHFLIIICLNIFSIEAGETQIIEITIKDHKFSPQIVLAKPGIRIKLVIDNQDDTAEEFESIELKREKIIPAKSKIHIILPPLEPGEYHFFGDFTQPHPTGILKVENHD